MPATAQIAPGTPAKAPAGFLPGQATYCSTDGGSIWVPCSPSNGGESGAAGDPSSTGASGSTTAPANVSMQGFYDGAAVRRGLSDPSGRQVVNVNSLPPLPAGTAVIGSIANTGFAITGTLPAFAATPTFNLGGGGLGTSAIPVYTAPSGGTPTVAAPGAVAPVSAQQIGGTDGTILRALRTDSGGRLLPGQGVVTSMRTALTASTPTSISAAAAGRVGLTVQVETALIRQELYTRILSGEAAEAIARTQLGVQIGLLDARSVQETALRIAGDKVSADRIDGLVVTTRDQGAAIATLEQASIDAKGGIAGVQTTIRQQIGRQDDADEALLRSLLAGDQADRARAAQLVQIQTEFTTTLVANEAASAIARQALLARMGRAEAATSDLTKVLADTTQSLVQRISAGEAVFNDATTGLAATRARLILEEEARAELARATSERLELLEASVNDPVSGLTAVSAAVGRQDQAIADLDAGKAEASSLEQVSTEVDGHTNTINFLLRSANGEEGYAQLTIEQTGSDGQVQVTGMLSPSRKSSVLRLYFGVDTAAADFWLAATTAEGIRPCPIGRSPQPKWRRLRSCSTTSWPLNTEAPPKRAKAWRPTPCGCGSDARPASLSRRRQPARAERGITRQSFPVALGSRS
ncbi:hypothetical protein DVW87_02130 [Sphingomonas aracearum]|uniref:Uncharacterized protein n=2 Tax=Sphingomonas aracearum TaxID=2283317 RepID=A0A369VZI5_9SPHN|nr:hypothetical protein DVW87_02130 [Sphingomonas aracearum]